jgi:hypothetical protein
MPTLAETADRALTPRPPFTSQPFQMQNLGDIGGTVTLTQLRARTFDTIPYATATVLESWRNLRHQQGGLLTDALILGFASSV